MALRLPWPIAIAVLLCGACGERTGPAEPAPPTATQPTIPTPPTPGPVPGPPVNVIEDEVTGDYGLTLDIGSGCGVIPEPERTRSYQASITSPSEASYIVTLTSGTFLGGSICTSHQEKTGCNQFHAQKANDQIRFELANNNDDAHGGHIVEQFAGGTWIEIIGYAIGRLDGRTIDASGASSVWYCSARMGYPFPCPTYSGCESTDMRLRFTRR
jgi:hypothetical protein